MSALTARSEQESPDVLSASASLLNRWLIPILCLAQVWIATQVTIANLPGDKIFVGHDSGFYTLVPHEFVRLSTQAWQVKGDFGFPNFEGLATQVMTLFELAVAALRLSQPLIGRIFFELQILLLELGTFWSLWLTLGRAFPDASRITRGITALCGALVATFNIFTALLLFYPPSNFQLGIVIWPLVIALEQYLLWVRPRVSIALLFGVLLAIAVWGNPAHTILGMALVAGFYAAHAIATKNWNRGLALATISVFTGATAFFWLPALSVILLYPGGGLVNVGGVDQRTLSLGEAINAQRQSIGALLRFDGLIWWPKTRNAGLFAAWPLIVTTAVPALIATAAAFSRSVYGIASWVLLLIGIELAKGLHPPFALDISWFSAHVPMAAAFRETYSKFILIILVALPTAFAIGSVYLWRQGGLGRAAMSVGFLCAAFNAWPFLAGRIAEPYFLTTQPRDYAIVDHLTGKDRENRILSFPGAPSGIHVTSWFKGGQFEDWIYKAKSVNAATFKERSISAATLFDDFSMQQPRELPELMGLLGIYHINYVLLHKDYLTSYRMAFDYERYKVLGRLIARASEPFLDVDPRLKKIFEGPNLVLYQVRPAATLPYVYGTYDAGLQNSYENALFGSVAVGAMQPFHHPEILFAGNQVAGTEAQRYRVAALVPRTAFMVEAPLVVEDPALYPNQISLPPQFVSSLVKRYDRLNKPTAFVFVQPHGDYINGTIPPIENIAGVFTANSAGVLTPKATLEARRVPREVLANFVGTEGDPAWPISAFFDQPPPDDSFLDDSASNVPLVYPVYASPVHLLDNTIERNTISSIVFEPAAVTYQFRLTTGPTYDEVIVASGPQVNASLIDDPKVEFLYQMPTPDVEAAWLRFVLRGPGGRLVFFDKQLDASGHLDDYGLRDNVQTALDRHFDELLDLHSNDRAWITSRKFFNAEQADDYRLTGVKLIVGKKPGLDATKQASVFSFKMRGITITLAGVEPPAYPLRGYYATFADAHARPELRNLQTVFTTRKNGAILVNASIQRRGLILNQSLAGRSADFKLKNGETVTASVLSELPNAYVISIQPGQQEQLYKSSIDSITAINQGLGLYGLTMQLPPIDLMKFPELHVRYLQGSDDEEVRLRLGLETPQGFVEVTPSYDIDPKVLDQTIPPEWIHLASPIGTNAPLALDGNPVVMQSDTGWREIVCDMRQIETLISTLKAKPRYLKLSFVLDASRQPVTASQQKAPVDAYSFGFGNVAFFGQESVRSLAPPRGSVFVLDSRPLRIVSENRIGGAADLLNISFAPVRVSAGRHRLGTFFRQPWLLRNAAFVPRAFQQRSANPAVRITRLDDLLYAVHVTAARPTWLALTETYNSGWRLIRVAPPTGRLSWLLSLNWLRAPVGDHVVGNAYNNTWYLKSPSSGDYVIDFAPQEFAIIGRAIAICAFLLAITLSALWWRRA